MDPLTRVKELVLTGTYSMRIGNILPIIEQSPIEDLKHYYPIMVENIFGWPGFSGWNLHAIKRDAQAFESNSVMKFLRSTGPLLDLSYKLMTDENLTYNFPVSSLPLPLQRKIKQNEVPAYLSNKLVQKFDFEAPEVMALNSFEFFFFTFTRVLLSGVDDSNYLVGWGSVSDSIYMDLFQDYLAFFFPCTGAGVPPILYPIHSMRSQHFNISQLNTSTPNGTGDMNSSRRSLFKSSIFQNDSITERELSFSASFSAVPEFRTHVWRSEAILNILITMWLSVEGPIHQFETILPSVELVKCVRVFTRHFHFFINSMSLTVEHPLDEIRRTGFPAFQKKLYVFLRYLFTHWSSDFSFRIVYETWLTYIQPWRYTKYELALMGRQAETEQINLEGKHLEFVLENLLFYTTLFQLIIPRLCTADYNSIKNAHMAYRIAKVFTSVTGLKEIIKDAEESLLSEHLKNNPRLHRHSESPSSWSLGLDDHGTLNQLPARHYNESPTSGIKIAKRIRELEGHQFVYKPLFSEETKEQVSNLLTVLVETYAQFRRIIPVKQTKIPQTRNWLNRIIGSPEINQPVVKFDQREKMLPFLTYAADWLATFFDVPKPTEMEFDVVDSRIFEDDSFLDGALARSSVLPQGVFLPKLLETVGNPDLSAAQSHEYRCMVKLMLKISRLLNYWVVPLIKNIYFEDKITSKLVRAAVAQPVLFVDYDKFGPAGSTRKECYLPPRINLRPLANENVPYALLLIFFLGLFFRIDGLGWILIPSLIYFFYIVICAMMEPKGTAFNVKTKFSKYLKP